MPGRTPGKMPSASEIATFTGATLHGRDLASLTPASLTGVKNGNIVFLARDDAEKIDKLNNLSDVACITSSKLASRLERSACV